MMIDWQESYEMLRDAVLEHLPQFVVDDDVAEEDILVEAIRDVGYLLRNLQRSEEGEWEGAIEMADADGPPPALF